MNFSPFPPYFGQVVTFAQPLITVSRVFLSSPDIHSLASVMRGGGSERTYTAYGYYSRGVEQTF